MSKEAISSGEQEAKRVRDSSTGYSVRPTSDESLFSQQNDYWIIRYHGQTAFLKSSRGLRYLAVLLRNSGREFHVMDLLAYVASRSTPTTATAARQCLQGRLSAGVPLLDGHAKSECRRRLKELLQDLSEAERFNDSQRKTEAQNEFQAITDYLVSAVGLGGRDRKTSSDAERARSAATQCIKKAIRQIGQAIPSLGYHLSARIKTGYFCSYKPHPERPVNWRF